MVCEIVDELVDMCCRKNHSKSRRQKNLNLLKMKMDVQDELLDCYRVRENECAQNKRVHQNLLHNIKTHHHAKSDGYQNVLKELQGIRQANKKKYTYVMNELKKDSDNYPSFYLSNSRNNFFMSGDFNRFYYDN